MKTQDCCWTAFDKGILFFRAGWSLGRLFGRGENRQVLTVGRGGFYLFLSLLL